MSNKDFINKINEIIREKPNESIVFSWLSKKNTDETTNTFITSMQNTTLSQSQKIIAFIEYAIANIESGSQSLYNRILTAFRNSPLVYTVERSNEAEILNASVNTLSLYKNKTINNPFKFVEQLSLFIALFRFTTQFNFSVQLIVQSEFITQQLYRYLTLNESNLVLDDSLILNAMRYQKDIGLCLLHLLNERANKLTFDTEISQPWLQLLRSGCVQADDKVTDLHFVYYWMSHYFYRTPPITSSIAVVGDMSVYDPWSQHPIAATINKLIRQDILKPLSLEKRGELLSLPCFQDATPLQHLANAYHVDKFVIGHSIEILLSFKSISIQNERDLCWLEILIPKLDNIQDCQEILNEIPDNMITELSQRNIHIHLAVTLFNTLKGMDLWTRDYKKFQTNEIILLKIIQKITRNDFNQMKDIEPHILRTIQSFSAYMELNQSFEQYENNSYRNWDKRTDNNEFRTVIHSEKHWASMYDAKFDRFIQHYRERDDESCLDTYLITNAVHCLASELTVSTINYTNFEFDDLKHEEPFIISDDYKKEISLSIQKTLIRINRKYMVNMTTDFENHELPYNYIMFIQNISSILYRFNLQFEHIVLDNPISKTMIQNMLWSIRPYLAPYQIIKLQGIPSYYSAFHLEAEEYQLTLEHEIRAQHLFIGALLIAANNYANGMLGAYRQAKPGNEYNDICSRMLTLVIEANINYRSNSRNSEYRVNPSTVLLEIQCIMLIMNYRIISYTEDKYEKTFYNDYLKNVFDRYPLKGRTYLIKFKRIFIAQINISLIKIDEGHLEGSPEKSQSLKSYLDGLLNDLEININELDAFAKIVYYKLACYTACTNVLIHHREIAEIYQSIDHYCIDQKLELSHKKIVLAYVAKCTSDHSLFSLPLVQDALKDNENWMYDYQRNVDSIQFARLWLFCLANQLTVEVTLKNMPLMQFYNDSKITENEDFKKLSDVQKSKILSAAYQCYQDADLPSTSNRPLSQSRHPNIKSISETFRLNDAESLMNEKTVATYRPRLWHDAYEREHVYSTALQRFSYMILLGNKTIGDVYESIIDLLAHKPNISNETSSYSWIETILCAMHDKDKKDHDIFIKILDKIPAQMMGEFLEKGIMESLINQLKNELCPLLEINQPGIYHLYIRFILRAFIICPDKMKSNESLIKDFFEVLFVPGPSAEFMQYYSTLKDDDSSIKEMIDTQMALAFEKALIPSKRKNNILSTHKVDIEFDNQLLLSIMICKVVHETLFLNVNAFNKQALHYSGQHNRNDGKSNMDDKDPLHQFILDLKQYILSDAFKAEIYKTIQKSIAYSLEIENPRWQSHNFIIRFFELLNIIAENVELDRALLLPKNIEIIIDNYYWGLTYESQQEKISDQFSIFIQQVNARWEGDHITKLIPDEKRNDFMTAIFQNANTYLNSSWNVNKPSNGENVDCATALKDLKDSYLTNDITIDNKQRSILFIKAMLIIMKYRFNSYKNITFDKSFYLQGLVGPLAKLKSDEIIMPEGYQIKLAAALMEIISKLDVKAFSQDKKASFRASIAQFNETLSFGIVLSEDGKPKKLFVTKFNLVIDTDELKRKFNAAILSTDLLVHSTDGSSSSSASNFIENVLTK